jgi:hypothetical protein
VTIEEDTFGAFGLDKWNGSFAHLIQSGHTKKGCKHCRAEPRLVYMTGKTTLWWVILGLSVFTDFLFVLVGFALLL